MTQSWLGCVIFDSLGRTRKSKVQTSEGFNPRSQLKNRLTDIMARIWVSGPASEWEFSYMDFEPGDPPDPALPEAGISV